MHNSIKQEALVTQAKIQCLQGGTVILYYIILFASNMRKRVIKQLNGYKNIYIFEPKTLADKGGPANSDITDKMHKIERKYIFSS